MIQFDCAVFVYLHLYLQIYVCCVQNSPESGQIFLSLACMTHFVHTHTLKGNLTLSCKLNTALVTGVFAVFSRVCGIGSIYYAFNCYVKLFCYSISNKNLNTAHANT